MFNDCTSLAEVMFEESSSLKGIGEQAFWMCGCLRHISLPEGLKYIGHKCFFGSGLEEITIPSSVAIIKDWGFCGCENLKKVIFQEGSVLREIEDYCFMSSGLEEFTAPPGLKRIHGNAFANCENLKRVILNEGLKELRDLSYNGVF